MITIVILVITLIALYFYSIRTFKYWEQKGIKCDKPIPIFGNNFKGFLLKASMTQTADEFYWKYPNERVVGFYRFNRPELIIRDPKIVKQILITDFNYFYARGLGPSKTAFEPLLQNLFTAEGDLWKLLRQRLTPVFSTGKLKAMFPLIVERAEKLKARTQTLAARDKALDARDLIARYTTDFIGACAFGLDSNSLNEENSAFRQLGVKIFRIRIRDILIAILKELFPETFYNLKYLSHLEGDINELVGDILKKRNYQPSGRHDFIDLLLTRKLEGNNVVESIQKKKPNGMPETVTLEFSDDLIAAQVFVFFAAGFETSSSAASFTLHHLAYNQDVQKKAQDEIDRVLLQHDGKLSYDAIKEMVYLEWVFKEGLRMFPPLGFLMRQCTKTYTFRDLNLTIDENVKVYIPLQAIQNDPQYFSNPEEFRPERFDPKTFDCNNRYVYLPFGDGPRSCIGARLALMQSLAGLAAILSCFTVEPAPETVRQLVVNPKSKVLQTISGGVPLKFRPRTKKI